MSKNPIILFFLSGLLCSQDSISSEITWLGGIYADTLTKANIKAGISLNEKYEYNEEKPHYYGSFKYADIELGGDGSKVSVGIGHNVGHGADRIGLSYARLKNQDLVGFEAVLSQMGGSIKLGYYKGLNDTNDQWLLGIGIGL